jgi:glycosyltransferase involved in cell wall biosynthesis
MADPAITWQLRRLIIEDPPDIVHGHDWLSRSFLPLRRWSKKKYGVRFVSTLHYYTMSCAKKNLMHAARVNGELIETACSGPGIAKCLACTSRHYGEMTGAITPAANLVGARAPRRRAATIVADSDAVARGNRIAPDGRRVVVIPNFLSDDAVTPSTVDSLTSQLPEGDFILFAGDLRPMKGLDVLLAAYAGLRESIPLILIGKSWPDTPTALPAGVVVHDRWPNVAVIEAFRRSAIAVAPSVWAEPFGIVVIEAMAGGTPVVASGIGGIPEIIQDGISGLLVPPGDAPALREALAGLIADPARRRAMGEAARLRSRDFAASTVVPNLEHLYRQLSSSK